MSLSKEYKTSKYLVYSNDLKYTKHRNLDAKRIIYEGNKVKYLYDNINCDSLGYRLYECQKSGMTSLDLNNLDLIVFPAIPQKFRESIKCLFIAENDLEILPDLIDFKKLEILEIGNNNITEIGKLPSSLLELSCRYNKIRFLPSSNECPKLMRLDCTNNEIDDLPKYNNLVNLVCNNNKLSIIPNIPILERLSCSGNNIYHIEVCSKLKYLDCSHNKLTKLYEYSNLIDLICNGNNIYEQYPYQKLKYLEIFNTPIKQIPFMPCLEDLLCDKETIKKLSKTYITERNLTIKVHKEKLLHIIFKSKIEKK